MFDKKNQKGRNTKNVIYLSSSITKFTQKIKPKIIKKQKNIFSHSKKYSTKNKFETNPKIDYFMI